MNQQKPPSKPSTAPPAKPNPNYPTKAPSISPSGPGRGNIPKKG